MPTLDSKIFFERLDRIYSHWKKQKQFKDFDAFTVAVGRIPEDSMYFKSTAIQLYLFAYEFPDLIITFCEKEMFFLSTPKRIDILRQIEANKPETCTIDFKFLVKKSDDNSESFEQIWTGMRASHGGKKMGFVNKDLKSFTGKFFESFQTFLKDKESDEWERNDVNGALASLLGVKEAAEMIIVKRASALSADIMQNHFRTEMEDIIDNKKVTQTSLSEKYEDVIREPKKFGVKTHVKEEFLDSCYTPIVQSYGKEPSDEKDDNLKSGVITCTLGARYKNYCSNVGRTYLVDPSKDTEAEYKILLEIRTALLGILKPGTQLNELYEMALKIIEKSSHPQLKDNLGRSLGAGMGIEYRETALVLTSKNRKTCQLSMIFNLVIQFKDIEHDKTKYSLVVADTIAILEGEAQVLTSNCDVNFKDISYTVGKENENGIKSKKASENKPSRSSTIIDSRTRQEERIGTLTDEQKRQQRQKELSEKLKHEAMERLSQLENKIEKKMDINSIVAYKSARKIPQDDANVRRGKIVLDKRNNCLLLPIFGAAVPFHIGVVKNCSVNISNNIGELRINFQSPGVSIGNKNPILSFAPAESGFIKELVFKTSTQPKRFAEITQQVKDALRDFKAEETKKNELADLVKQDKLILSRSKNNPLLNGLYVRPQFSRGRAHGVLEAHENGFRFTCKNQRLDILYSNIRNAFFQPCNHELIVLIHFHLKNPIMAPYTKKQREIQFYTEVMDATQDLGGRGHTSFGDRDEIESEQREKRLRNQLNKAFKSFTDKVQKVPFDQPLRQLGFNGVVKNTNVFLMPTADCLVSLTEQPVTVFPLEDVEVAHLERVSFGSRNFDLVLVDKDYTNWNRITAIETTSMEVVKDWLNQCEIRYYEAKTSISWDAVLKEIRKDIKSFFDDGGWDTLEQEESDEDDEEMEDEYQPSDSESDDYSESESDYSDASEDEPSTEEDEESGDDWEEHERRAKASDRRRDGGGDDDEDEEVSRKRSKSSSSSSKSSSSGSRKKAKR